MSSYQNFCELYVSLVPHHHNLRSHCQSLSNVLNDEKEKMKENKREKFKQKSQKFLKELIQKLLESLELLKMVAFDLGNDYVTLQCNLKTIESESEIHQENLKTINEKINEQQQIGNLNIHTTREEFLEKYKKLIESKSNYEENQKLLDENCKVRLEIEEKLICKKEELKKVLCEIKIFRSKMEPNVPMSDFDVLRDNYEKASFKLSQLNSTIDCCQTKIAKAQLENEIMRKTFKSELKIFRAYDDFTTKELIKRKRLLENKIECICVDESDHEIKKIEREIFIVQQKIESSERSMKELAKIINKFQAFKRPCPQLSVETLKRLKEEKAPVYGIDYQGSKFVKFYQ